MKVAIIGGGISGLTTAYRLSRSELAKEGDLEIHIYDAAPSFGGVIKTETQGGFLLERGPDAFITAKPWALDLCKELGLENELVPTNPKVRQSFILSSDKLIPVPRGFYLMAPGKISDVVRTPLLSWAGKLRMCCELFIPRKENNADESLAGFVRRRFGREVLERIAQPMIAGIYTADPEKLSLAATFPHFLKMEQEHGSVIRALGKQKNADTQKASGARYSLFLSLKGGMQILISTLISQMPRVNFHSSPKAVNLEKKDLWTVSFESGESIETDVVCLALSATVAKRLIQNTSEEMARDLSKIKYEQVATLNLAFHRKDIKHPLDGLGYVVPAIEKKNIVGCTFSSVKFEQRSEDCEKILLRIFLGGKASRELLKQSDEAVVDEVLKELKQQIGISSLPITSVLSRWPEAIPQYGVGHQQTVEKIFEQLKLFHGLYLTGNAYEGTGVPDCIRHASETSKQILCHLKSLMIQI